MPLWKWGDTDSDFGSPLCLETELVPSLHISSPQRSCGKAQD